MSSKSNAIHVALVLGLVLMGAPVRADEPSSDKAKSEALFNQAVEQMKAGQFAEACPMIAESQRLDPTPGTLYTLAECESRNGRIATAIAHYREYLQLFTVMSGAQREKHEARSNGALAQIAALEAEVPTLILILPKNSLTGIEVSRDGSRVEPALIGIEVQVDPGEHLVVTQLPSGEKVEQPIVLEKRDKKTLELKVPAVIVFTKPDPPVHNGIQEEPQRTWQQPMGIAAIVGGGVGVTVGTVLGGMAIGKKTESNSNGHCDSQDFCDSAGLDLRQQAVSLATGSDAALIVGGVFLVGGIVLFATAPQARKQDHRVKRSMLNARLEVGFGGAWVKGTW